SRLSRARLRSRCGRCRVEVLSAIALPIPSLAAFVAVSLVGVMVGAIATHLLIIGGSPAPAAGLPLLSSPLSWDRRSGIERLLAKAVTTGERLVPAAAARPAI